MVLKIHVWIELSWMSLFLYWFVKIVILSVSHVPIVLLCAMFILSWSRLTWFCSSFLWSNHANCVFCWHLMLVDIAHFYFSSYKLIIQQLVICFLSSRYYNILMFLYTIFALLICFSCRIVLWLSISICWISHNYINVCLFVRWII